MKKVLLTLAIAILAFIITFAQVKKTVNIAMKKTENMRGANPNIKVDVPTVDVEMAKPSKTRDSCTIAFINNTGYYINIYVEGYYKGTLGPWEKVAVTVNSGYTNIYCMTINGAGDWSASGDCKGNYTYNLN
jgi:hypothetical protein